MTITIFEYDALSRDNAEPMEPAFTVTRAKALGLPAHEIDPRTVAVRIKANANVTVRISADSGDTAAATDRYIAANGEIVVPVRRRGEPLDIVAASAS